MFGLIQNINYILISAVIQTIEMNLLFLFLNIQPDKSTTLKTKQKSRNIL